MSWCPPEVSKNIVNHSKIEEVIAGFIPLSGTGKTLYGKCPKCQTEGKGKGLTVTASKGIYKCFTCEYGGKSPIDFLKETQNMDYPQALKYLADKYNILIPSEPKARGPQKKGGKKEITFRDRQLKESGLTDSDQKATWVVNEKTQKLVDVFETGTRDQYGKIAPGDDMIIWYYDLNGKPMMYQKENTNKMEQLFRIRWQNPDLHKDKPGVPMKYASPYKSGSHLFIPQAIRDIYHDRRIIKRLFIQEGEKKAIKACKHGIPSVGIMGIHNLGQSGNLPYELELIIPACKVEEVIFVLDSDWDHLSNEIVPGQKIDKRPLSFFYAVKNYKKYFKGLMNQGIYLEIYFAHINENERKEKGIDDLLAGSLAGKENDFYDDVNSAINKPDNTGEYITLYKISTMPDTRIMEYWNLHNAESFAEKYRELIEHLPEFEIGQHKWRYDKDGKFVSAQPLEEDERFWGKRTKEDSDGNKSDRYNFNYIFAYNFLKRRGYGRYKMEGGQQVFVHVNHKTVEIVEPYDIRDYILEFTKAFSPKMEMVEVMNMFYRGSKMYLGPDSLSHLDPMRPFFQLSGKGYQQLFFRDKYWMVTAEGIEEKPLHELENYIWKDKINDFDARLIPGEMVMVERYDEEYFKKIPAARDIYGDYVNNYDVELSEEALSCHFLMFLKNTGEFFWRKYINERTRERIPDDRKLDERLETDLHLVSKMTAIGYMLHKYRDKSCEKAIIAMDGKISEIGESNGRSGKSLLGLSLSKIIRQTYIGAKAKDLTEDPFLLEEVNEKTDNLFLDDCRANVDFEHFFPWITGKMTINRKGHTKFTLSEIESPKILLTTNHAINGNSSSFRDRQALIAFSDFYSDSHKPVDDFGINFFDEWDEKQWNLFYNFMARCLQLYFKAAKFGWGVNRSGLIEPPTERLELRRLRQFIGESFLAWADEYWGLSDDVDVNKVNLAAEGKNLNNKIPRLELYNDFLDKNPNQKKYMTSQGFMKKIWSWCQYRKLRLNPHCVVLPNHSWGWDKQGGVEFITVANEKF